MPPPCRLRTTLAAVTLLATATTACGGTNDPPEPGTAPSTARTVEDQQAAQRAAARDDLADARRRWAEAGVTDYRWTVEVAPPVPPTAYDVVVRDGEAVEAPVGPPFATVEEAFASISDALAARADLVQVTYAEDGRPLQLAVVTDLDDAVGGPQVTTTGFRTVDQGT